MQLLLAQKHTGRVLAMMVQHPLLMVFQLRLHETLLHRLRHIIDDRSDGDLALRLVGQIDDTTSTGASGR